MSNRKDVPFSQRAKDHPHPLAKKLLQLAERKQTNVVLSADLTTTKDLLAIAETLGPYIAVLKSHIDIISDFSNDTISGLTALAQKHDFLIFEDRKFIDIGNTVQKQYRGGALKIHDWAHIVNASVLPGAGVIQALDETISDAKVPDRGVLILAEMTSKGSLAVGDYTRASVEIAREYPDTVIGFVATKELSSFGPAAQGQEDFIVFTTGVNISSKGDALGQQYQTPTLAMAGGSDFLIAGRGIYAVSDPVAAARFTNELNEAREQITNHEGHINKGRNVAWTLETWHGSWGLRPRVLLWPLERSSWCFSNIAAKAGVATNFNPAVEDEDDHVQHNANEDEIMSMR